MYFGFDCDLDLFLSSSPATATDGIVGGGQRHLKEQSFGSDINLDTVFQDLTDLLGVVAQLTQPTAKLLHALLTRHDSVVTDACHADA